VPAEVVKFVPSLCPLTQDGAVEVGTADEEVLVTVSEVDVESVAVIEAESVAVSLAISVAVSVTLDELSPVAEAVSVPLTGSVRVADVEYRVVASMSEAEPAVALVLVLETADEVVVGLGTFLPVHT
jgi:hypothetical protein